MPSDEKNNLDEKSRAYAEDFMTSNYQLEEGSVDLALKPGKAAVEKAVGIFTGSSILTPHAKFQLQNQIKAFLQKTSRKDDTTVLALVRAGLGVSMIPASFPNNRFEGIHTHPISDRAAEWTVAAAWRKGDSNPLIPRFLDLLKTKSSE